MIITTAEEARQLDKKAMDIGLTEEVLMENAGRAVIELTKDEIIWQGASVVVVAGTGNNGGDGFVAARYAKAAGASVMVITIGNEDHRKPIAKLYKKIAEEAEILILHADKSDDIEPYLFHADIIIDALIGTGLTKELSDEKVAVITAMNMTKAIIISIDLPSGMWSDTGEYKDTIVCADMTVAMGSLKRCHVLYPAIEYVGKLFYSSIGIPDTLRRNYPVTLTTKEKVAKCLPRRLLDAHKGNNGTVGIIAGSEGMEGAALLAAAGSLYSGAGKTTILTAEKVAEKIAGRIPEAMVKPIEKGTYLTKDSNTILQKEIQNFDVIAIGPGMGRDEETQKFIISFIKNHKGPIVVDADALYAAAMQKIKWDNKNIVITPHVGEMARLTGLSAEEIEKNRIDVARNYAVENQIIVVLKGAPTVIACPSGETWINPTGNPGMATGGMGDVLTGIIASYIGQGLNAHYDKTILTVAGATMIGVYMHGYSADLLSKKKYIGMTANEVAENVRTARQKMDKFKEKIMI